MKALTKAPRALTRLEHQILNKLREAEPASKFLLGVSGGLDSMCLLHAMFRLKNLLKAELRVGHVHHGENTSAESLAFRDKAQRAVQAECQTLNIPFLTNEKENLKLESEAELRSYRRSWLKKWSKDGSTIVLAHTANDLLETRLLQMIRGTGLSGFRSFGFASRDQKILRPLITTEKSELFEYAKAFHIPWVEDPTNQSPRYLRNWLRLWLGQLEKQRPKGVKNLSLSLDRLSESTRNNLNLSVAENGRLSRRKLSALPRAAQRQAVAQFFNDSGFRNYTTGHIQELLKRLDTPQKEFTFTLLKEKWHTDAEYVWMVRLK